LLKRFFNGIPNSFHYIKILTGFKITIMTSSFSRTASKINEK